MALEEDKETSTSKDNGKKASNGEDQKVSFYKMFSFADRLDVALMIIGSVGAIGNGLGQPLMTLIFGQLIDSFGTAQQSNIVKTVSKVNPLQIYLDFYIYIYWLL